MWTASSRPIIPEIEQTIESEWKNASARKGIHLFDGPMCRLESFVATDAQLTLTLSPTSYKPFVGTNLSHADLADRFGPAALANSVGLSTTVISADGHVLLGRRNARVAYYPKRIHPFSGALESAERIDVFAEIRRELDEELSLNADDIELIVCLGIASDRSIRQPELIFFTRSRLSLRQLQRQLDEEEHIDVWTAPLEATQLLPTADPAAAFTPIGLAALLLTGRDCFGEEWFARHASTWRG